MVCRRIIEIDRALNEAQTKHTGIEIDIPLRVARNTGDVMKPG
jgi:hypothetical protein